MTRVKRGFVARRRRKRTEGFQGRYKIANQKYIKAHISSYRDRKNKKRQFRRLWITRINSFLKPLKLRYKLSYNKFIFLLKKNNINLNRKILAQLSCLSNEEFHSIIHYCFVWNNAS